MNSLPNASSVSAPEVAVDLQWSIDQKYWSDGDETVSVGTPIYFRLTPASGSLPSTITMSINGANVNFTSGAALGFVADKAGEWIVTMNTAGFVSNTVKVTAR